MSAKNKKILQIVGLIIIAICVLSYLFVSDINSYINRIVMLFASGDIEVIREFIQSYGPYAMAISFFLMVFQSIMAPLPAFFITFSNAALFGWWQGAILSWTSAMAGAILCFYISRLFGRDVAEKFTTKTGLAEIDNFFEKYGAHSILIARLLPFMSFDIVSYAAGLTSIKFIAFTVATGLGQLPATIVYSYVGGMLVGGARLFVTGLLILFALCTLGIMLKKIFDGKKAKKLSNIES